MDKQMSLYSVSSIVLIILLRQTIEKGHWLISVLLIFLLLIQVIGAILSIHEQRQKKRIPSSK